MWKSSNFYKVLVHCLHYIHRDIPRKKMKNFYQKGTFLTKSAKKWYFLAFFQWKTYCKRYFGTIMTNYFCWKTILCIIYALVCFCTTFGEYFEPERYFFTEKCQQLGFFHNVSHQDWVTLDQSRQFIESQPFQCLNMIMMNGCARLRFEFILYNCHHTTIFESRVVTI